MKFMYYFGSMKKKKKLLNNIDENFSLFKSPAKIISNDLKIKVTPRGR